MAMEFTCDNCGERQAGQHNWSGVWFAPTGWIKFYDRMLRYYTVCGFGCFRERIRVGDREFFMGGDQIITSRRRFRRYHRRKGLPLPPLPAYNEIQDVRDAVKP